MRRALTPYCNRGFGLIGVTSKVGRLSAHAALRVPESLDLRQRPRIPLHIVRVDRPIHFHYSGNVENKQAIDALSALAHDTRLKVFRLLVEAGPAGMAAGAIGEELKLPPATLSFHLAHLARAGLAVARQQGRFVIYSANFETTNGLVEYLTENCCGGRSCVPAVKPKAIKGVAHEALPRARRRA